MAKEVLATHATLHCSRCGETFKADETPGDKPCVGGPGASHDLHGNLDGPGAPKDE